MGLGPTGLFSILLENEHSLHQASCRLTKTRGALETVLPVYGPFVSYVPDGDNSNRTNPAHRESAPQDNYRSVPIGTGACEDPTGG